MRASVRSYGELTCVPLFIVQNSEFNVMLTLLRAIKDLAISWRRFILSSSAVAFAPLLSHGMKDSHLVRIILVV